MLGGLFFGPLLAMLTRFLAAAIFRAFSSASAILSNCGSIEDVAVGSVVYNGGGLCIER
jgi:hypothetical protein